MCVGGGGGGGGAGGGRIIPMVDVNKKDFPTPVAVGANQA